MPHKPQSALEGYPQRSLLLATEALNTTLGAHEPRVAEAEDALRQALGSTGGLSLGGHDSFITALAISPDGRWLVAGGGDNTARLWNLRLNELMQLACRTAGRNLTPEEWQQFLVDALYHQTCPQFP